jgi:hypothetical protein
MAGKPFETAETFGGTPRIRQLSVFLEDRVGALMRLFKTFEGSSVRVVGLAVLHTVDCSIVRLICDDSDTAIGLLKAKSLPCIESDLLVVEVPQGEGLMSICAALLSGEVNIDYAYPLLVRPTGRTALAIRADNLETAAQVLKSRNFCLVSEQDLGPGAPR